MAGIIAGEKLIYDAFVFVSVFLVGSPHIGVANVL